MDETKVRKMNLASSCVLPLMDKAELLELLAKAKARADKAHIDVVMHSHVASAAQVADACTAHVRLKDAENAEQKHIAEMSWLLDELNKRSQKRKLS